MEATWYFLLAGMLVVYVVLDGFDFGVGVLHLFVARTDAERRQVLAAIGPVWDGNEVWLIAAGGTFVFAFPLAYAVAFSGLYLALMLVLWLLVLRGIAIEFRSRLDSPLWASFWDAVFAGASTLMAIVLGVALGNVVRGVPIDASGTFEEELFTNLSARSRLSGAIDWYTGMIGIFALVALAGHGATYLNWKTTGEVQARSRAAAMRLWILGAILAVAVTVATGYAQPRYFAHLGARPWLWIPVVLAAVSLAVFFVSVRHGRDLVAFLASSAFFVWMLLATAGALYPTLLRSTIDAAYDIDAHNAASGRHGLLLGLVWWVPALLLALGYFTYLFQSFRGKVTGAGVHD